MMYHNEDSLSAEVVILLFDIQSFEGSENKMIVQLKS
jgi:hypothetical protein